ncbi:MAG: hypothetical protein II943_03685 [Victivallales bacterium]|nr:hypothetical protein [Victivallales bacterium]
MKVYQRLSLRLALFVVVFAVSVFAGIVGDYYQYDASSFKGEQHSEQPWLGAQMISMHVTGGNSVWLANYINSWYWPTPVPDLNGTAYQMGAGQYGYLLKSELQGVNPGSDYSNLIHWSDGKTKEITYTDNNGHTNPTTAYYLDYFGKDDDIYFVMTSLAEDDPNGVGEVVDSFQYVNDRNKVTEMYNPDTVLTSRLDATTDIGGNVRINFGLGAHDIRREFVAVWSEGDYDGNTPEPPSGQPLPGAMIAGVLSLGTVLLGKRLRRRS